MKHRLGIPLVIAASVALSAGCIGTYHYVDYLPFVTDGRHGTAPQFIDRPTNRAYRERGVFEAFARANGVEGEMREEIVQRAAAVGCDALVIVPVPPRASAQRTTCEDPPPMIRAVCIEWLN